MAGAGVEVAFDVTPMLAGSTGVATYSRELLQRLPAYDVTPRPFAVGRGAGVPPAGTHHLKLPLRVVQRAWRSGRPPAAERIAGGGQVTHSIDLVLPTSKLPIVATVHDLAPVQRPDLHPPRARDQMMQRLEQLSAARVVITVSQATADSLQRLGIRPANVTVIPLAARRAASTTAPASATGPASDRAAGQARPYLLAVGELTPRKDYATLLAAMTDAAAKDLRLVIVGPVGWRGDETHALAERLRLGDRVRFTDRVSDGELQSLYDHATALCFPSIDEGFGIPLVEAMSHGLPVVASDIPVVREVTAGAALTVPVGDVTGFAAALATISNDPELRQRLALAGREQAATFSWDDTARRTAAAYRMALECA